MQSGFKNSYIQSFLQLYNQNDASKVLKYVTIVGIEFLSKLTPEPQPITLERLRQMCKRITHSDNEIKDEITALKRQLDNLSHKMFKTPQNHTSAPLPPSGNNTAKNRSAIHQMGRGDLLSPKMVRIDAQTPNQRIAKKQSLHEGAQQKQLLFRHESDSNFNAKQQASAPAQKVLRKCPSHFVINTEHDPAQHYVDDAQRRNTPTRGALRSCKSQKTLSKAPSRGNLSNRSQLTQIGCQKYRLQTNVNIAPSPQAQDFQKKGIPSYLRNVKSKIKDQIDEARERNRLNQQQQLQQMQQQDNHQQQLQQMQQQHEHQQQLQQMQQQQKVSIAAAQNNHARKETCDLVMFQGHTEDTLESRDNLNFLLASQNNFPSAYDSRRNSAQAKALKNVYQGQQFFASENDSVIGNFMHVFEGERFIGGHSGGPVRQQASGNTPLQQKDLNRINIYEPMPSAEEGVRTNRQNRPHKMQDKILLQNVYDGEECEPRYFLAGNQGDENSLITERNQAIAMAEDVQRSKKSHNFRSYGSGNAVNYSHNSSTFSAFNPKDDTRGFFQRQFERRFAGDTQQPAVTALQASQKYGAFYSSAENSSNLSFNTQELSSNLNNFHLSGHDLQ